LSERFLIEVMSVTKVTVGRKVFDEVMIVIKVTVGRKVFD
jgi:hypothetical protein